MRKYDVIIVGGGLAGLECGAILSKKGMSVCILEQSGRTGGFFQPFFRNGKKIDTSIHYVGSLDEGMFLNNVFRYLDVWRDLDLVRLNKDGFEKIHISGKCYSYAMGHENFAQSLSADFPHMKNEIELYTKNLKETGINSLRSTLLGGGISSDAMGMLSVSAFEEIEKTITDTRLQQVLTGHSLIYSGERSMTPFYLHAITSNSYLEGAYRFRGGADRLTDAMTSRIREGGGVVRTKVRCTSIITDNKIVKGVKLDNGEVVEGKYVISTCHPAETLSLLGTDSDVRKVYRNRINSLKNSPGLFCLYLVMKPGAFPYLNENHYIFGDESHANHSPAPLKNGILASFQPPVDDPGFAEVVTLVREMEWREVERWSDTIVEMRGEEYREFKERVSNEMISLADSHLPGLKAAILNSSSASPLTFRDYLGTPQGSAYGLMKSFSSPLSTIIPPKTKVQNLYLAGQSLNFHGVMGVTVTSLLTCSAILGTNVLTEEAGISL
ncbi:MAG: NAD(P)/FAD-dependent oxidoreductase [Bacteroidales bacterium]|nr:NAD(P)/FAD-dependent oxidoreductase [Bacteroidales bacterium]